MRYGLCNLGIVPLRAEASDKSELTSQVLYGERFKVLEKRKKWSRVRLDADKYEGWIDNKQYVELSEDDYNSLNTLDPALTSELVEYITTTKGGLLLLPMGSDVSVCSFLKHKFEGTFQNEQLPKHQIVETALLFINSPYLWGGKSAMGIDCSGLTQLVYRLCGYSIMRDASQQATQGEALSFIEESEPGDLAFFDNEEGAIIHVGIIMKDHHIIHAHGKVRIDRLDHSGIFNSDLRTHTHKLRVIKRIA